MAIMPTATSGVTADWTYESPQSFQIWNVDDYGCAFMVSSDATGDNAVNALKRLGERINLKDSGYYIVLPLSRGVQESVAPVQAAFQYRTAKSVPAEATPATFPFI